MPAAWASRRRSRPRQRAASPCRSCCARLQTVWRRAPAAKHRDRRWCGSCGWRRRQRKSF
eukprot:4434000-Prymnesium_polylepis.1